MRHGWAWYWHRLRAMGVAEIRQRLEQKQRQRQDARRPPDFQAHPPGPSRPGAWPLLPDPQSAPAAVLEALRHDLAELASGRMRMFGHLLVAVDDPPRWFTDYAARTDVPTGRPGFALNHRELPRGADIKMVWELSRWHAPVRFAQAAWLLGDTAASGRCVTWLGDWVRGNPPYIGWNWTSALEAGMRLLNFCWIDALLVAAGVEAQRLDRLRQRILPAHAWYVSRHRSYGSSANNHLLGELAGLIAAVARWPALEAWAEPLSSLHAAWEREVLAQFAGDGGNREQALNYQLYSWELCWHARNALLAAGIQPSMQVEERLRRAADFFVTVQVPRDPWDYGDSDSATAVPVFANEAEAAQEWFRWFGDPAASPALAWWLGAPPEPVSPPACVAGSGDWLVFPESGQAVCWAGDWQLRWDLSPLGYLSTAAHGHLDALHLSVWLDGVALVIDPGTAVYYADTRLREWLASWEAHNGPQAPNEVFPRRAGPFLWAEHHARPQWRVIDAATLGAELVLPHGVMRRQVRRAAEEGREGWQIDDFYEPAVGREPVFRVAWQFAPGTVLEAEPGNPRYYRGRRGGCRFTVGLDAAWARVRLIPETHESTAVPIRGDLEGLCSPAFRRIQSGPRLVLDAHGSNPAMYRTTIARDDG